MLTCILHLLEGANSYLEVSIDGGTAFTSLLCRTSKTSRTCFKSIGTVPLLCYSDKRRCLATKWNETGQMQGTILPA